MAEETIALFKWVCKCFNKILKNNFYFVAMEKAEDTV